MVRNALVVARPAINRCQICLPPQMSALHIASHTHTTHHECLGQTWSPRHRYNHANLKICSAVQWLLRKSRAIWTSHLLYRRKKLYCQHCRSTGHSLHQRCLGPGRRPDHAVDFSMTWCDQLSQVHSVILSWSVYTKMVRSVHTKMVLIPYQDHASLSTDVW